MMTKRRVKDSTQTAQTLQVAAVSNARQGQREATEREEMRENRTVQRIILNG